MNLVFRGTVGYNFVMSKTKFLMVSATLVICITAGCSKRQIIPGILTGTGAATLVTGVIYRASLDDADSLFGDTSKQKAIVSTLTLTGLALMATGVILAATTPLCESSQDCFSSDVCDTKTQTCVPRPLKLPNADSTQAAFVLDPIIRDRFELDIFMGQKSNQ
jgi:hypothetical protein